jgi:hypothetical protein
MSSRSSWPTLLVMNYPLAHPQHVRLLYNQSPNLTFHRQIRGTMVYDTDLTLLNHRTLIVSHFLLLSPTNAFDICTTNHVERHVVWLVAYIVELISPRLLPPWGTCSTGVFWMDYSNNESLRVYCAANCWAGCCSGKFTSHHIYQTTLISKQYSSLASSRPVSTSFPFALYVLLWFSCLLTGKYVDHSPLWGILFYFILLVE